MGSIFSFFVQSELRRACMNITARNQNKQAHPQTELKRMHLKWFNASKGFGFLVPEDNSFDAFFHITILQDVGLNNAGEGAIFDCEIYDSGKGMQVERIVNIIETGAIPNVKCERTTEDGRPILNGIVKWFKPEKGFGFIIADDGQKDVFIHKTLLDKNDIPALEEGQRVEITVKPVNKGREATSLKLL